MTVVSDMTFHFIKFIMYKNSLAYSLAMGLLVFHGFYAVIWKSYIEFLCLECAKYFARIVKQPLDLIGLLLIEICLEIEAGIEIACSSRVHKVSENFSIPGIWNASECTEPRY